MKIDQLKSIIREAVREEVKGIIEQAIITASTVSERKEQRYDIEDTLKPNKESIYEKIKEGMNLNDLANFSDENTGYTKQNYQQNITEEITQAGPHIGVSAAQLPFIKKAGEIYKKSSSSKNKYLD